MLSFDLDRVLTVTDALAYLALRGSQTRVLAGGTDLLVEIREGFGEQERMRYVLDISDIPEFRFIREEESRVVLGPLTTFADVMRSSWLAREAPLLVEAATLVGSPQVRSRGTLGGNIATASPSADGVCALVALNAEILIANSSGNSWLPLTRALRGPHQTALAPDQLITALRFPCQRGCVGSAFTKLARRNALGISRVNVAVILEGSGAGVEHAQVVIGAALPIPQHLPAVEAFLAGRPVTAAVCAEAGRIARRCVRDWGGQRWSSQYKLPVVEALVARTVARARDSVNAHDAHP